MNNVTTTSLMDAWTKVVVSKAVWYLTPAGNARDSSVILAFTACATLSALAVAAAGRRARPLAGCR